MNQAFRAFLCTLSPLCGVGPSPASRRVRGGRDWALAFDREGGNGVEGAPHCYVRGVSHSVVNCNHLNIALRFLTNLCDCALDNVENALTMRLHAEYNAFRHKRINYETTRRIQRFQISQLRRGEKYLIIQHLQKFREREKGERGRGRERGKSERKPERERKNKWQDYCLH